MFCHRKASGFRPKTHCIILEHSNAFLSGSICGWSVPLVSLPFICRFQRRRGTNRPRHYLQHLGPCMLNWGAIMTWGKRDALLLVPGNYRDMAGGMQIHDSLPLCALLQWFKVGRKTWLICLHYCGNAADVVPSVLEPDAPQWSNRMTHPRSRAITWGKPLAGLFITDMTWLTSLSISPCLSSQ